MPQGTCSPEGIQLLSCGWHHLRAVLGGRWNVLDLLNCHLCTSGKQQALEPIFVKGDLSPGVVALFTDVCWAPSLKAKGWVWTFGHRSLTHPFIPSEDWNRCRHLFLFIDTRFLRHPFFISEFDSSASAAKGALISRPLPSSPPEDLQCEWDKELMKYGCPEVSCVFTSPSYLPLDTSHWPLCARDCLSAISQVTESKVTGNRTQDVGSKPFPDT